MTLAFFRRHRKWFMVLMFMALFSIVIFGWWHNVEMAWDKWRGKDALSVRVGSIGGQPVTERQFREFRNQLLAVGDSIYLWLVQVGPGLTKQEDILRFMALTEMPSAMAGRPFPLWRFPSRDNKPTHEDVLTWIALYNEAVKLGFSVPPSAAEARLKALQQMGMPQKLIMVGADQMGLQQAEFVDALCKDMTMKAYINWLAESMSQPVEPEMRRAFTKEDERIQVRLAALKADDAIADIKDVPEAELQAQFDKYKKDLPGASGYGYKIPDKVQIEYLVADPAAFEADAQPRVTDELLKRYYDIYKDRDFVAPEAKPKDGKAAADLGDQPPERKYEPFDKVKAEIRTKLLRRVAEELAKERLHTDTIEIRQASAPPDLGMWADGQKVRLVKVPLFRSDEELADMKGIGDAARGQDSLHIVALQVDALVGKEKAKMALKEMSDVFTDRDGTAYAFRVTAVEPSHEAAGLKEVRDKVLADVRRMKAFEIVRERAKTLLKEAEAKGLLEAAKQAKVKTADSDFVTRDMTYMISGRPMTIPTSLPEVGISRVLLDECFRMAKEKQKLAVITLTEKHMAVVVEILGEKAPRQAMYDLKREELANRISQQVAIAAFKKAIDPKNIRARLAVVVDEPEGKDKGAAGDASPSPQPADYGDE